MLAFIFIILAIVIIVFTVKLKRSNIYVSLKINNYRYTLQYLYYFTAV